MRLTVFFADPVHCAVQTVSPNALEACAGLGRRPATRRVATGLRWGWRSQPWPAPPAPARLAHVVRQPPARSGPLGLLASGASAAALGASEHVGTGAGGRRLCTRVGEGTKMLATRRPITPRVLLWGSQTQGQAAVIRACVAHKLRLEIQLLAGCRTAVPPFPASWGSPI